MGVFDNFAPLDGLLQVIYHSTSCFVLLSNVETSAWVVELGLVGGGNRWWRGSWSEKDVSKLMGSSVSDENLEIYSTKLANFIVAGELSVGDWNANEGGDIKLQLNPTHKAPVAIDMTEVPTKESAARAITFLKGIALQTQSRGCRINGDPQTVTPSMSASKPRTRQQEQAPASKPDDEELRKAEARIKRLENEINLAKQVAVENLDTSASKPTAPKPRPGASKANPTRKKRKIVQAEFESD